MYVLVSMFPVTRLTRYKARNQIFIASSCMLNPRGELTAREPSGSQAPEEKIGTYRTFSVAQILPRQKVK